MEWTNAVSHAPPNRTSRRLALMVLALGLHMAPYLFEIIYTELCKIMNWNRSESHVAALSGRRQTLRATYYL